MDPRETLAGLTPPKRWSPSNTWLRLTPPRPQTSSGNACWAPATRWRSSAR